jgi:hypothetical protein
MAVVKESSKENQISGSKQRMLTNATSQRVVGNTMYVVELEGVIDKAFLEAGMCVGISISKGL